jgi:hypothetical protein
MAKWWQGLRGCKGEPRAEYNDQTLECHVYCEPSSKSERAERRPMGRKTIPIHGKEASYALSRADQQGGAPILKLCGMKGVGHDLNTPYQGYPFDIAW